MATPELWSDVPLTPASPRALLVAARAVLEQHTFEDAARVIFDSAKDAISAAAGYIAILTPDGQENEVLFLDSGGRPCDVAPELPMPIRGLRAEAYRTGRVVYDNDFSAGEWTQFLPPGHVRLDSVLFAPLPIAGKVVGLLGLANKPGGFADADARLAARFGEFAASALKNSRDRQALANSERRLRTVMQTANDAVVCTDADGTIILWLQGPGSG